MQTYCECCTLWIRVRLCNLQEINTDGARFPMKDAKKAQIKRQVCVSVILH